MIQPETPLKVSVDPILLADFVDVLPSCRKILDLGAGIGTIPILLAGKTKAHITGIEIQHDLYDTAIKNIEMNGYKDQINMILGDMKDIRSHIDPDSMDAVVTNPPFYPIPASASNGISLKELSPSKHELTATLDDVIKASSYALKPNGYFAMVHRPERFMEIIDTMRKYHVEPKKIRFCYTNLTKDAKILLIQGVKNGKTGMHVLSPLIIGTKDGTYTEEVLKMCTKIDI